MGWNIEGIAESVIHEMKQSNADINDLNYYLKDAFRSVQCREPNQATLVIEEVKEFIEENYEEQKEECSEG